MSSSDVWQVRQSAIADFGMFALRTTDLDALFQEACNQVARGLQVPAAKVATRDPGSQNLILRAAVGLPAGIALPGRTIIPGGNGSAMGHAVMFGAPVISEVAAERRFEPSNLVRNSGVKISANVVLWVEGEPYGCLEADSLEDWDVTDSDVDFLQTYGNLVAAAIERQLLTAKIKVLANERQVLLNEVFHRIKNMLSNVEAIARRTVKYSSSLDHFLEAFSGRIGALSRAHDLLLAAPDKPARLKEIFALEFEAKGLIEGQHFRVAGSDILCSPRTIQALALLLFELSTNAVKYGALSERAAGHGFIDVAWTIEQSDRGPSLVVTWRERGVPSLRPPDRRGFGSELIERLIPAMLHGSTRTAYYDDGIECVVAFPLN